VPKKKKTTHFKLSGQLNYYSSPHEPNKYTSTHNHLVTEIYGMKTDDINATILMKYNSIPLNAHLSHVQQLCVQ